MKDFLDLEVSTYTPGISNGSILEEKKEELTLQELQELVRDLSMRVAKLEQHHATF